MSLTRPAQLIHDIHVARDARMDERSKEDKIRWERVLGKRYDKLKCPLCGLYKVYRLKDKTSDVAVPLGSEAYIPLRGENFLPIEGFDGKYEVSNYGNIRTFSHTGKSYGKKLKTHLNRSGYIQVALQRKTLIYRSTVHRHVAKAFLPNPEGKLTVNHKDGVRTNNNLNNLEWSTYSENLEHSFRKLGRRPQNEGKKAYVTERCPTCGQKIKWKYEGDTV